MASLDEVRRCYLEGDGHVSVIKNDAGGGDGGGDPKSSGHVPGA